MSSASHAHSGSPSFGSLLVKILLIAIIWAALVFGTMHYVGNVWPKSMQISQAVDDAANEKAKDALTPPKAETPTPPAASSSAAPLAKASTPSAPTPAAPAASPTPAAAPATVAASTAAPAAAAASGSTAAAVAAKPTASAPKGTAEAKLPKDPSLAGYDRSAMWNVAVFYSIVISVFAVGAMIMQVYKYRHVGEEEHAH